MKTSPVLDHSLLKELGVLDWGYTEDPIPTTLKEFQRWVELDQQGPLQYLADHRKDLRSDLRLVYPEFQSALVFLFSYQETKKWMIENDRHQVAAYALGFEGEDYHRALKVRLGKIFDSLKVEGLGCFQSIDAQPILERDLAYRSGLGWFGKNSMLINRREGSYFIIGSLLLNRKLPIDEPGLDVDHCGQCTACVEACPTQAIDAQTRTLEASKCISTFTIETFRDADPPEGFERSRGELFGCDICQDVCPWNKKPLLRVTGRLSIKEAFQHVREWVYFWPREKLFEFIRLETNRSFKKKLFGTPFDRPGREGWMKNLKPTASRSDSSKTHKGEE